MLNLAQPTNPSAQLCHSTLASSLCIKLFVNVVCSWLCWWNLRHIFETHFFRLLVVHCRASPDVHFFSMFESC